MELDGSMGRRARRRVSKCRRGVSLSGQAQRPRAWILFVRRMASPSGLVLLSGRAGDQVVDSGVGVGGRAARLPAAGPLHVVGRCGAFAVALQLELSRADWCETRVSADRVLDAGNCGWPGAMHSTG